MNRSIGRSWIRWIGMPLVAALALAGWPAISGSLHADGPGTMFLQCRSTAHANYNTCLVDSYDEWERTACDLAWNFDLLACDAELVGGLGGALLKGLKSLLPV